MPASEISRIWPTIQSYSVVVSSVLSPTRWEFLSESLRACPSLQRHLLSNGCSAQMLRFH